jgi:hypothetical protein
VESNCSPNRGLQRARLHAFRRANFRPLNAPGLSPPI